MRTRWLGVLLVAIAVAGIVAYKHERARSHNRAPQTTERISSQNAQDVSPAKGEVMLVADLSEANEKGDNCAEIVHLVRDAGKRGIKVQEFSPDSNSPLLKQYHVLTNPTVLVLDADGKVVSRYEGEGGSVVQEIRDRLANLSEVQR